MTFPEAVTEPARTTITTKIIHPHRLEILVSHIFLSSSPQYPIIEPFFAKKHGPKPHKNSKENIS
jgi:hypothetical protein